ncbi:predicted protein [Naegleria gruberi]|uniref:Predicted protein n=1 Tax=Naegleria gruberi TaxID=5762 RepID=D2W5F1_NAEGR|nr:uncharacterized protein NAEGRDRAFT_76643 [Naegleria gruberi]EFC35701.1 predicted protein [Naegleria gruberi]|eukprot:XP_002668445.1 predicted protein [Naegleria gruberi strain NEG-M]
MDTSFNPTNLFINLFSSTTCNGSFNVSLNVVNESNGSDGLDLSEVPYSLLEDDPEEDFLFICKDDSNVEETDSNKEEKNLEQDVDANNTENQENKSTNPDVHHPHL